MNISHIIAEQVNATQQQVDAAITLLDEGATVPFIARYRKEATHGLDDTQLRNLEERLHYLRELDVRRASVLKTIEQQGKLTTELKTAILQADSKTRLEDLYAPYKPKRRSKAQIAREAGLEPLLDKLLQNPSLQPQQTAVAFINEEAGVADSQSALEGARQIFMERVAEQADLIGVLREWLWDNAILTSTVIDGQQQSGEKFTDYFDYREALKDIPSHRALALFRGRSENVLQLKLHNAGQDDLATTATMGICDRMIAKHFELADNEQSASNWLLENVRFAWRVKISYQLESELNLRLREHAELEAIQVFGHNLRDLLLAAPAGARTTIGLDPGLRTGVKVVVVDSTGKLLDQCVIYPHVPKKQWHSSIETLAKLALKYKVELLSIGNGTASRETDKLAKDLMSRYPQLKLHSLVVSEAGASVYSASELAAKEFPDLDVSYRGAVSIARRLQDPLAELVKIDAKAIGVGQYQHDVNQLKLARKLDSIVEDCVNAVGVEINTASAPLLAKVAGLSNSLANNIVEYREQKGAFMDRSQLLSVPRLGAKAFEQAAGFMRISNGDNPLDASSVHPEAYPVVERILAYSNIAVTELLGNSKVLSSLAANDFVDTTFGEPTVIDIIAELDKPGRDPRPEFKTANFKDGIEQLNDLKQDMMLEGVVTNVTNFGAFIDIGVHQDGLVHISNLSETFVKDPREVVKTGQVVKIKVLEVDSTRKRIALTMRLTDASEKKKANKVISENDQKHNRKTQTKTTKKIQAKQKNKTTQKGNVMAAAFAKLKQ